MIPSIEEAKALQAQHKLGHAHVVYLHATGFVIAHTNTERERVANGEMPDLVCSLHVWLREQSVNPRSEGWYVVNEYAPVFKPLYLTEPKRPYIRCLCGQERVEPCGGNCVHEGQALIREQILRSYDEHIAGSQPIQPLDSSRFPRFPCLASPPRAILRGARA